MTAPDHDDDDNKFARGAMNASLLSLPIWALVIGFTLWGCNAFAQSANAGAESNSGAVSGSTASSGSVAIVNLGGAGGNGASPNVNAAANVPNQRTIDARAREAGAIARATGFNGQAGLRRDEAAISYSGGTNSTTRVEGTQTLRNVPQVYAPSLSGGNPCSAGVSGGGAVAGFGITLGAQWSDAECERRQLAALAFNSNQTEVAREIMCGASEYRQARIRTGQPCVQDMPQRTEAAGPVQMMVPVMAPAAPSTARSFPEWCYTATAQERRRYPPGTCG